MPAPKAFAMKAVSDKCQNFTQQSTITVTVKQKTTIKETKKGTVINHTVKKTSTEHGKEIQQKPGPSSEAAFKTAFKKDVQVTDPIFEANRKKALKEEAAQLKRLAAMKRTGKYTCLICKDDVPKRDMEVNSAHYPICINCKCGGP